VPPSEPLPSRPAPRSLGVVIVAWESGPELLACLDSLVRHLPPPASLPVHLVVVDNASSNLDRAALHARFPSLTLLSNPTNLGFGPAANRGVRESCGDVVLLLNPDTEATPKALEELVRAFIQFPGAVAVAPRMVDAAEGGGEPQERFQLRRLPTWGQVVRELLLLDKLFPNSTALRRERYLDVDRQRPFPVEQPAAAALAIRREVFLGLGGFDERFVPAWFEDVDLCRRLATVGPILFWPDAVFVHRGGAAATRLGYHRFLPLYYRNACRYWRKHAGALGEVCFRALLLLGMGLRLLALPLRPHPPRSRWEAARAYLRTALMALGLGRPWSPARGISPEMAAPPASPR